MKTLFRLLVTVLLLGGWAVSALSLHVVRTPDRVALITKSRFASLEDTYVDTRAWTIDDVSNHGALVTRLLTEHKEDILQHVIPAGDGRDLRSALADAVERGPVTPKAAPAATKPAVTQASHQQARANGKH